MSIQFEEVPESRGSTALPPTATYKYKCSGEVDDGAVRSLAISATPSVVATIYGLLNRQDIRIDPDGYAQYWVTVPYGQKNRELGSRTVSFSTTGATIKIKCAKVHKHTYWNPGLPTTDPITHETITYPDDPHAGAIGVTGDGTCEGADVVLPALKLDVSVRHPAGVISVSQIKRLAAATGQTNSDSFLEHDPGELLFLGASGTEGTNVETEVRYELASSQNITGGTFGPFTGVDKKGWELVWIEFMPVVNNAQPATQPKALHIEQVYDETALADALGSWG